MADRIKGITIELDGEATGLKKALSDVTQQSIDIQKELNDVNRLLKFDPGNTEALAQKQQLLSKQIEITSQKLQGLKDAQSQVDEQFSKGSINEQQYRAFQREIQFTEASLDKLKQSLSKVDDGNAIKNLKDDMSKIPEEANKAEESVKGLGSELTNLAAGAAAGIGIGEIVEKSLETSSLNTQIDISFNVPEESVQSVKNAIGTVETYGVDSEAALEGVRRQWALNKDASDESNTAVVQGAATIVAAYGDVDFTELIQETNELSKTLGISNEDALALTYSLLQTGFPPDQLDIITEYGSQLHNAGYNAQEIQAIMAAGVETGTWNIDVLLDGLKEGRIKLAEFGQGVNDSTAAMLQGTSISSTQLQQWGQDVAAGGEAGKKAMQDVAAAVAGIDDKTKQNQVGVAIFGTLWEENGTKVTDTILGMNDNLKTAEENQNNLNSATESLNSDPMVQLKTAVSNLMTALAPLLTVIANVIGKIAEWVANNPTLAATITTIVATLGILIGIVTGLAPIITMITSLMPILAAGFGAIAAPVLIVIGVITALIAIGVALYANWDLIKTKAAEVWNGIAIFFTETIPAAFQVVVDFISNNWAQLLLLIVNPFAGAFALLYNNFEGFRTFVDGFIQSVKDFFANGWTEIVTFFTESVPAWLESMGAWFAELPNKIAFGLGEATGNVVNWGTDIFNYLTTNVPQWIDSVGTWFSQLPDKIWNAFVEVNTKFALWAIDVAGWINTNVSAWIDTISTYFSGLPDKIWTWLTGCVTKITTWGTDMQTEAKTGMGNVVKDIEDTFKDLPSKMLDIGKNIVAGLKNGISSAWSDLKSWTGGLISSFLDGFTSKKGFDIHSPSRVMMKIGGYVGDGFAIGIGSTVNSISKQANAIADAAMPNVNAGNYDMGVNYKPIGNNTSVLGSNNNTTSKQPIILQLMLQNGRAISEYIIDDIDQLMGNKNIITGRMVGQV